METSLEDITLNNVYVLLSAFEDEGNIVPVKLEIKEFKTKKHSVCCDCIGEHKKDEVVTQGDTINGVTQYARSSEI